MLKKVFAFGNNISRAVDPGSGARKVVYEPKEIDGVQEVTWAGWTSAFGIDAQGKPAAWGMDIPSHRDGAEINCYDERVGVVQVDGTIVSRDGVSGTIRGWTAVAVLGSGEVYALHESPISLHRFSSMSDLLSAGELPPAIALPSLPNLESITLHPGPSNLILLHPHGVFACGDTRHGVTTAEEPRGGYDPTPVRIDFLDGLSVRSVCLGGGRAGAVTDAGDAFIWGKGFEGFEGFERIELDSRQGDAGDVKFFGLGSDFEVVVLENDEVWVRGANQFGQLGLGKNVESADDFTLLPMCSDLREETSFKVLDLKVTRWAVYITVQQSTTKNAA